MIHFRHHNIHLVLNGVIGGLHVIEVTGDQNVPAILLLAVLAGEIRQLAKVLPHMSHLELPVVLVEGRALGIGAVVFLQVFAIVEGFQINAVPLRAQEACGLALLQVGVEELHAAFAETAAGGDGRHGQLALVQLHAGNARVDHEHDDLLQVLPPHGVVAAHLVAGLFVILHLHPLGVDGVAVHITGGAFLPQVGDQVAFLVPDAVGVVVLQAGGEGVGPLVLAELPQAVPVVTFHLGTLVHAHDVAVLVHHHGIFPALHLKHDAEELDAPLVALGHKVAVVHVAVHLHPGIHRAKGLVVQIGQGNAAAAHASPGQHRAVVHFQFVQHLLAAGGKAGVVAMLVFEPTVKINAALHKRSLL